MSGTRRLGLALGGGATVVAGLGYSYLWRQPPLQALPAAHPAASYDEAIARAEKVAALEADQVDPISRPFWLTHGASTQRAIVLLHGFTNSPRQYIKLAAAFHARGYNVFVPRFPFHGYREHSSRALAGLTAEALVNTGMEAVDIARGLGRHVTVFGLSLGGLVTAWMAHRRSDIDRGVMVAPALAFCAIPDLLLPLAARILALRPDAYMWWDPKLRDAVPRPPHAYPGYRSTALAAMLRLAVIVRAMARRQHTMARSLVFILNPCDESVDNRGAYAVARGWRRRGANVLVHELPAAWQLIHDIIDPAQPEQQIDRVYPQLIEWSEYPYYVAPSP